MTEIPEHLRRRAADARARATAATPTTDVTVASQGAAPRIPAHLLDRSQPADQPGPLAPAAPTSGGAVAPAAGPGGHTQRLLTVVKSGSIQEVKATPVDKVHTWPHLLAAEFVAALACLVFLFLFSVFVNAPLLQAANPNLTPNPSKAPWYFLGLQELMNWIHPMIAGVTIPGTGIGVLLLAPYIDRNPSNKPEDRKFATSLFALFLLMWATLTMIGSFFRGPGQNFVLPWRDGLFFEL